MKQMIEFDDIVGRQDGGVDESFHLKVTRHDHGEYNLIVSRRNPDGEKQALADFVLTHADVQAIADLANTQ
jgi:hypothetical protein